MTIKSTKMPRIDPKQLLKTLSVLLSPKGGIKSADEVNRLVQLMQKFSKKLVSKCIYIQILKASSEELLDKFLMEKGWGLLNLWFADAIRTNNWSECGCLIQLFAQCPMTAARLKENVEVNQAPKLIRQLSCDQRVDEGIRNLAVKVLNKWMSIVQSTNQSPPVRVSPTPAQLTAQAPANGQAAEKPIKAPSSPTQHQNGHLPAKDKNKTVKSRGGRVQVSREFINSDSDSEGEDRAERRNSVGSQGSADEGATKSDITDDDTKPIKLLQGMSEELSQTLKKEVPVVTKDKSKEKDLRREKERSADKDKERSKKEKERSRQKEREREERRKQEREKERQREKERREKRSKPYSQTELKNDLDSSERDRIKMLAQKMKDEAKNDGKNKPAVSSSLTAGLGKIPKIPKKIDETKKKEDFKKDKGGASFADLLGAMDSKVKKPVKVASSKNKNKELLESLSSTNLSKQPSKTKTESKPVVPVSTSSTTNSSKKESSSSPSSSPPRTEPSKKDLERRDSKDAVKVEKKDDKEKEKEKKEEKEKPSKLVLQEKKVEKRSSDQMSPQIKEKKKTLTESSMFGDILSTIMKDDIIMKDEPRKKKRRLSDVKAERAAKEAAEQSKKEAENEKKEDSAEKEMPTFSFYRDALEEEGKNSPDAKREGSNSPKQENGTEKNGSDTEMDFQEPKSSLPREVIGILVYAKGIGKAKKSIRWEEESNLVQIEYFEMNEDERVNVNKIKFNDAKQRELALEKSHLSGNKNQADEESPENRVPWRLVLLDSDPPVDVYGKDSTEKGVQELRENSVLQALFFNNKIPADPTEPDVSNLPRSEPKLIPSEDTSDQAEAVTDFSPDGWPDNTFDELLQGSRPPAMDHDHVNELLSSINPNLIQNVMDGGPPPATGNLAIDNALMAAQFAAAETLRKEGLLPPSMPGPTGGHFDVNIPPPHMLPPPMDHGMFPDQGGFPPQNDFQGFAPMDNWRGPGGPRRGFGNEFGRGGPRGGGFQRNDRQHFGNNRGFDRDRHRDRSNQRDDRRGDDRRGDRGDRRPDDRRPPGQNRPGGRPCKFWMETGTCREEQRCRFAHPPLN